MTSDEYNNLKLEAMAFDSQIEERVAHGHIPDLRFSTPCDYFFNNPWRRSKYVELDFGEIFKIIKKQIDAIFPSLGPNIKILEVGCGPGYMSLELSRAGYDVVGIDISEKCIDVAKHFASLDPTKKDRAHESRLNYICGDFFSHNELHADSFDAIVFVGALHHFPDQESTLHRAKSLLREGGILIAHEPVRDKVTKGNAAFCHLLRVVLSINGGFYKNYKPQTNLELRKKEIDSLFNDMRYETDDGQKSQSVNDNEAGYSEMFPALEKHFSKIHFDWRHSFFHEFIGGLRLTEKDNFELAHYLRDMDKELCELNVLQPTEFFYVGKKY